MSQVFLLSDTHFFHQRIIEFCRPQYKTTEEMNEAIVDNWNRTVTKRDTVWLLGDVCFGHARNLNILRRLQGTKNLIMGNHDQYGIAAYLDHFNKIEAAKKYDGYLLTHVPIHPGQFYRFKGNVHGHLHESVVLLPNLKPDNRYVNVSCEQVDFTPITWDAVKERFK
jgi:calcineurin-like phosphoesterase family protein